MNSDGNLEGEADWLDRFVKTKVGDNVTFAANSYIKDKNIPNNVVVFGQFPNNIIKKK